MIAVNLFQFMKQRKNQFLQDFVETADNPFEQGKSIVGLGNKGTKNKYQKMRERLQERIENEPQLDIKEEVRKGNIDKIIDDSRILYT